MFKNVVRLCLVSVPVRGCMSFVASYNMRKSTHTIRGSLKGFSPCGSCSSKAGCSTTSARELSRNLPIRPRSEPWAVRSANLSLKLTWNCKTARRFASVCVCVRGQCACMYTRKCSYMYKNVMMNFYCSEKHDKTNLFDFTNVVVCMCLCVR